jgi:diguanylate cyclase (GGDEF)-like protein
LEGRARVVTVVHTSARAATDGTMSETRLQQLKQWAWLSAPVIGAVLIVLYFALPAASSEQSIVYDLFGLAMVGLCLIAIRLHRPAGWLPWLILAMGQLAFVLGDIIWTIYATLGEDPFPSAADVAYLAGYPLLAVGLVLAIRRRVSGGDRAEILDGAILATGAVVVWWTFVLGPLVAASDPDPLTLLISAAYPVGDLLLIGMALGLLMAPGARSISFLLVIGNLVVILVGDLVFGLQSVDGSYVEGGLLDAAWLVAYAIFAAAALHPTMAGVFDPRPISVALLGPFRLALLGFAMLVGPALLVAQQGGADSVVLVVAAATAVLSILVLTRLAGMVGHLAKDVERRAVLEAQLSYQAFHDSLTGLANRRRFIGEVGESIAAADGTAVLFLDLDDFKHVNDEMGHDAGDALLSAVGHRIVSAIRPGDLGCRIGGDEFAVLLPHTSSVAEAEAVGGRLLEVLGAPVPVEGRELVVPASIGVAMAQPGEMLAVDELLRRADVAMYGAKARGKHCLATYQEGGASDSIDLAPAHPPSRHARATGPTPTTWPSVERAGS